MHLRGHFYLRVLLAFTTFHWIVGTASFASASTQLHTLTTCRAAHHLSVSEAARHYPVRLRAVVTYYEGANGQYEPLLFVSDRSGGVYVSLASIPSKPFVPGDRIEVTGTTAAGDYAPIVANGVVHVLGRANLPAKAPRVGLEELLSGKRDGQWIEIEAVVHSVHTSYGAVLLNLATQKGMIFAHTPIFPGLDYENLVDARIVLRGNAAPLYNHQKQITGSVIFFPGFNTLRVIQAPPADAFALPLRHVSSLLQYTPDQNIPHRVHLRGMVTLLWAGRILCVQDDGVGLCAQITQTDSLRPGDMVDVIGFPAAGEFTPTLVDATYRAAGGNHPAVPVAIDVEQALEGQYDSKLVSMEGQVLSENAGESDPTFLLSSGKRVFSIVFAKGMTANFKRPPNGSRVRVTGICSAQSDSSQDLSPSGFPTAKSFRILPRSTDDLVVLQRPSWWNAVHTLCVLAVALVFALVALLRGALLSRRVNQQTGVIRTQLLETAALKEAAEFHASHDELTGTRNRRKIFTEFQREYEIAMLSGDTLGVIMVDLDHFKRVNDTYGHLVGDEVLKEAVRRVTRAVRSTDLVGRYGGEEFMVVLPHCDKFQIQTRAERIRAAIASEPIIVGDLKIFMTTSVGTAITMSPPHAMLDALAAADSALYQAKHCGRNRVVLKDLATGCFEEALIDAA